MKRLLYSVVFATLLASPALAQSYAGLERPAVGPDGRVHISSARAAALRSCSAIAAQYPEYLWGNMESYQYRVCMYAHHQVE